MQKNNKSEQKVRVKQAMVREGEFIILTEQKEVFSLCVYIQEKVHGCI